MPTKHSFMIMIASMSVAAGLTHSLARATPPEAAPTTPSSASTGNTASRPVSAPVSAPAQRATVEISFVTVPPTDAVVTWGKTRLGRISPISPLVIVRPRDSGPIDVMVRAEGFLPVQTRAHTFADTRVSVKLTRPTETSTLLGYKIEPKAPEPVTYDPSQGPVLNVSPGWDMTAPQNMTPVTPVQPAPLQPAPQPAPTTQPQTP